jgi:hypothetical protein
MQMVQNKKFDAGLALIAGLLGMCITGTALALPEMIVGSRPGITASAQSVEPADAAIAGEADTAVADEEVTSPSN